jgi:hypothetical protein
MIRLRLRLAALLMSLSAGAGHAQEAAPHSEGGSGSDPGRPVLRMDFPETEAIPGQPLSLRLTVLVPTYLPDPPVWPSLDAPNLLVSLPEGSTNPTSQRIDGETWAGITRHYRISPMVPGKFSIPPQPVIVTYANPQTNGAVKATLTTDPLSFTGAVPEGAEGLDPFIAAEALELRQEIAGDPSAMIPGDSVTRTVTARIRGTSPVFLPDLLPSAKIEGVAAYPEEPVVEERDDRGEVSGTRTESVTYLAEGGGHGETPPVALDWYNLQTGKPETASLDGFPIAVSGPPVSSAVPRDWRMIAATMLGGLILLAVAATLFRRAASRIARRLRRRKAARLASERHAYHLLLRAISRRDLARLYPALDTWAARSRGPEPTRQSGVKSALAGIGAAHYGREKADDTDAWLMLERAIRDARQPGSVSPSGRSGSLPPLNPGGAPAETRRFLNLSFTSVYFFLKEI